MANDPKPVEHLTHGEARANIPAAEMESVLEDRDRRPIRTAWERRNRDLDPQLVWRGKDPDQDAFAVEAPPIYLQEHVHPKALIDDLRSGGASAAGDLFGHFGLAEEDREAEVEFYRHSRRWSNRMILGDALQVMASLAEREGLRGQVQAIYIDPPYGIRFNSNFQWSTTSRDVKDGRREHLTREPEQVRAFRDTWRDGIHSYLGYLRDRLVVARELLAESGSCFVQIGDENVHRVRALMDEVFGEGNFVSQISVAKTAGASSDLLAGIADYILWFTRNKSQAKYRQPYFRKTASGEGGEQYSRVQENGVRRGLSKEERKAPEHLSDEARIFRIDNFTSQRPPGDFPISIVGRKVRPSKGYWKTGEIGTARLLKADRLEIGGKTISYVRFIDDFAVFPINNIWTDTGASGFGDDKLYVVQTISKIIQRCLLMTTDPGDLVLDPTCGSGTTAHVAEQWGRRWITIDTSRVALALARARIMGARHPYYLLADSPEGQRREAEVSRTAPSSRPTHGDLRAGFVYERVPHVTLKSIANNAEIDVIWDRLQPAVEAARAALNEALSGQPDPFPVETGGRAGASVDFRAEGEVTLPSGESAPAGGFMEWEAPREPGTPWPAEVTKLFWPLKTEERRRAEEAEAERSYTARRGSGGEGRAAAMADRALAELNLALGTRFEFGTLPAKPRYPWPEEAVAALGAFWEARIARQREIDASIAAKAEHEYLYDKPYEDKKRVRVAGPFTVESLSPHRSAAVDEHGEIIEEADAARGERAPSEAGTQEAENFRAAIMENLSKAGVQQADRAGRIAFDALVPWPGTWIAAEGRYREGEAVRRAGVFIGPEYGTVSRPDLVACAQEAAEAGMDMVIACAFNFEARAQEFHKLGRIPILHARMNADLHMAGDLKAGGGNLFVVFGEPDIEVLSEGDMVRVELRGVDIFRPATGEVESSEPDDIACWFVDTDYSGESFFVRQAYFPGAEVPYKALRTTLKGEIDEDAWQSLKRTVSRPFPRPRSGRIAVKVINHLGDEVMKVFGV